MAEVTCGRCGSPLVTISLQVGGGERSLHSCSTCDHRSWTDGGGEPIHLDLVLTDLAEADAARSAARRR